MIETNNITGSNRIRVFHVMYIPFEKLFDKDKYDYQERMLVFASNYHEAKQFGKKDGMVLKITQG
tara:strand:+ start:457 stop:651 length:195 start_codon:yes stop_codon:yes gene_type:complete